MILIVSIIIPFLFITKVLLMITITGTAWGLYGHASKHVLSLLIDMTLVWICFHGRDNIAAFNWCPRHPFDGAEVVASLTIAGHDSRHLLYVLCVSSRPGRHI